MGAVRDFVGVLRQTPGPSVSAASVTAAAAEVAAAVTAAATVTVVVGDDVTAAVMRMLNYLVSHVLLMGEKFLQSDYGGDHESDLAYEQGFAGDQRDRAECERQQSGRFQGHCHHQRSKNFLRLLCNVSNIRVLVCYYYYYYSASFCFIRKCGLRF